MVIEARGEYQFQDILRGMRLLWRSHKIAMYATFFLGPFLLLTSVSLWFLESESVVSIIPGFLLGAFLTGSYWLNTWSFSRKFWKTNPNLHGESVFRFDDSGVFLEGINSHSEVKWEGFMKWKEGKDTFLLFYSSQMAQIVPKRFFSDKGQLDLARQMFAEKIAKSK